IQTHFGTIGPVPLMAMFYSTLAGAPVHAPLAAEPSPPFPRVTPPPPQRPAARTPLGQKPSTPIGRAHRGTLVCSLGLLLAAGPAAAQIDPNPTNRVAKAFDVARQHFLADTNDAAVATRFARACFDWAELATSNRQRAAIAEEGIAAARRALALDRELAAAHYYLGLNLGQLARTKFIGALALLDGMEQAWLTVIRLDPKFDYAGAHRVLGSLYHQAPGWPTSLGDRVKARHHFETAVALSPDYPENRLALCEAMLDTDERDKVVSLLPTVAAVLQAGRERFSGPDWELAWMDWDRRWHKIRARAFK
ncbi:MAG TPA: hypothetical protein VNO52_01460, partial [Methylomirabilota bacterium]|nr:hypothetical protein [Methylomirabilota bacterium]